MVLTRISCIDRARVMADGAAASARPSSETAADGGDADPLVDGLVGGSQTPADANKKRLRQSSLWRYASPASRKRKRIQEGRKRAQEHAQAMWYIYREGHLADIRQMASLLVDHRGAPPRAKKMEGETCEQARQRWTMW